MGALGGCVCARVQETASLPWNPLAEREVAFRASGKGRARTRDLADTTRCALAAAVRVGAAGVRGGGVECGMGLVRHADGERSHGRGGRERSNGGEGGERGVGWQEGKPQRGREFGWAERERERTRERRRGCMSEGEREDGGTALPAREPPSQRT